MPFTAPEGIPPQDREYLERRYAETMGGAQSFMAMEQFLKDRRGSWPLAARNSVRRDMLRDIVGLVRRASDAAGLRVELVPRAGQEGGRTVLQFRTAAEAAARPPAEPPPTRYLQDMSDDEAILHIAPKPVLLQYTLRLAPCGMCGDRHGTPFHTSIEEEQLRKHFASYVWARVTDEPTLWVCRACARNRPACTGCENAMPKTFTRESLVFWAERGICETCHREGWTNPALQGPKSYKLADLRRVGGRKNAAWLDDAG